MHEINTNILSSDTSIASRLMYRCKTVKMWLFFHDQRSNNLLKVLSGLDFVKSKYQNYFFVDNELE
jgi:hypothetical protein